MKYAKYILMAAGIAILVTLPCIVSSGQGRKFQETETLDYDGKRIRVLNVINGLYLSGDQIDSILDILYDLEEKENALLDKAKSLMNQLEQAYRKLEADLLDDDLVDEGRYESAGRLKHSLDQLEEGHRRELASMNTRLNSVLSDKQKQIIQDAEGCIVPPKNSNNTRIGQSDGASRRAIEKLERMRKLDRFEFENVLSNAIAMQVRRVEVKSGTYDSQEMREEIERIADVAVEAYEMSDFEFEIRKEELAAEMKPRLPEKVRNMKETRYGRADSQQEKSLRAERKYDLDKAGRLFLDTDLIDIFETKLAQAD